MKKEEKEYTGSKLNRIKSMIAVGLLAATALGISGMMSEAHAAGQSTVSDISISKENQARHQAWLKKNFKKETVIHEEVTRWGTIKREEHIVYVPTKEHQEKINKTLEQTKKDYDREIRNEKRKKRAENPFKEDLRIDNPNSPYYNPDWDPDLHHVQDLMPDLNQMNSNNIRIIEDDDSRRH